MRFRFRQLAFASVFVATTPRIAAAADEAASQGAASVSASTGAGLDATATGVKPAEAPVDPRDRAGTESTTLKGGVGLLRTQHAQSFAPGQFSLQLMTEFFSSGFLCTAAYPCPNPRAAGTVVDDSLDHMGGHLNLTMSLHKFVEAYASTSAFANSSNQNRPGLLQVLGDSVLGAKVHGRLMPGLFIGGSADLLLVNGTGSVGLDGGGTSGRMRALVTTDLRDAAKPIPVRASVNLGYTLDNTGEVVLGVEQARKAPISRIERYGLNVNRTDHFDISAGLEGFLMKERLRPFIDFDLLIPVNRQGYKCRPRNPSADRCLANEPLGPSRLTIGARVLPWKRGFAITGAVDIGVEGTKTFIEEMSPVAPWVVHIGAGWSIDTEDRVNETVKTVERVVERGEAGVDLRGFVHEVDKPDGIPNAVVAWENHPEKTSLVTAADGRFLTHLVEDGEYKFAVKVDGYRPGSCSVTKKKEQVITPGLVVDCPLIALPRVGVIVGRVLDAETNAPIPNAAISVTDAAGKPLGGMTDERGMFRFETLPAGATAVTMNLEGYLAATETVDVKSQAEAKLDVLARKKPKNSQVTVGDKEIFIKQQVQFAVDSAVILPQSQPLLAEIADALIKNPRLHRVEVQGHTDNTGTPDHNKQLSEERANAVRTWLTSHGVAGDRLTAKGFGQDKPLLPNVTQANRGKNRRVQFVIQDQDPAPKGAPKAAPKK